MLILTFKVDAPVGYDPTGIKELIAMRIEDLGDVRCLEVREVGYEQLRMSE